MIAMIAMYHVVSQGVKEWDLYGMCLNVDKSASKSKLGDGLMGLSSN